MCCWRTARPLVCCGTICSGTIPPAAPWGDGIAITGYTSAAATVTVPAAINGQTVLAIAPGAFAGNTNAFVVDLPDTVREIGHHAFAGSRLDTIHLGNGLETVGDNAFSDCAELRTVTFDSTGVTLGKSVFADCVALRTITLPEELTLLPESSFYGCTNLYTVTLPAALTEIGSGAFSRCGRLVGINLGSNVRQIAPDAFLGCGRLAAFTVTAGNMYLKDVDGVLFSANGKQLLAYPAGRTGSSYTLPAQVTAIAESAFAHSRLTSVTANAELQTIGDSAFLQCHELTAVDLSACTGLTSVGMEAFYGSTALTTIELPGSLLSIGEKAFAGCTALTMADVPAGAFVHDNAFDANGKLTIVGYAGSSAQEYAFGHDIRFLDKMHDIPVTGVTMDETEVYVKLNATYIPVVNLLPANTTETELAWTTTDPSILLVGQDGVVQAVYPGTAELVVWAKNGSSAVCTVHVVLGDAVTMPYQRILMDPGAKLPLSDLCEGNLKWTASSSGLTVAGGELTAVSAGQYTLTVAGKYNQAECTVYVRHQPDFRLPAALRCVEDNAFVGSMAQYAELPDSVQQIGSRAFVGCNDLKEILLSGSKCAYGSDVFEGCGLLTILCPADSAAEAYAVSQGIDCYAYQLYVRK